METDHSGNGFDKKMVGPKNKETTEPFLSVSLMLYSLSRTSSDIRNLQEKTQVAYSVASEATKRVPLAY